MEFSALKKCLNRTQEEGNSVVLVWFFQFSSSLVLVESSD